MNFSFKYLLLVILVPSMVNILNCQAETITDSRTQGQLLSTANPCRTEDPLNGMITNIKLESPGFASPYPFYVVFELREYVISNSDWTTVNNISTDILNIHANFTPSTTGVFDTKMTARCRSGSTFLLGTLRNDIPVVATMDVVGKCDLSKETNCTVGTTPSQNALVTFAANEHNNDGKGILRQKNGSSFLTYTIQQNGAVISLKDTAISAKLGAEITIVPDGIDDGQSGGEYDGSATVTISVL